MNRTSVLKSVAMVGVAALTAACGTNSSGVSAQHPFNARYWTKAETATLHSSPSKYEGPRAPAQAPKHVKIALISCDSQLEGCQAPVVSAAKVAKDLGWKVITYNGGGTPSQENADILNAISSGANVIGTTAISPNGIQQGLAAAKKAGVLVVSGSNGIDTPNPVEKPLPGQLGYAFDVAPNYFKLGKEAGTWIIANSKGQANIALFSDKEFPSVIALQKGLLAGLAQSKTVKVSKPIYFTGSQVGTTLGTQTVDYLHSHSSVNYVFSPYDPAAAAQVSAIQTAGMGSQVRLVSVLGDNQNLNFIRKGEVQVADAAYDNRYMGYAMIDQIIRSLDHKPLFSPAGEHLPYVILDKSNLPSAGSNWVAPFAYKSKFMRLWK